MLLRRLVGGTLGRWIAGVGIAGATVQVVGLQRWVTLVPGVSADALDPAHRADAEACFELLHTVLGKVIGETIGYALTATFTVLGVVIPVVEAASLTNFAGYVTWCAWLIAVAFVLFR